MPARHAKPRLLGVANARHSPRVPVGSPQHGGLGRAGAELSAQCSVEWQHETAANKAAGIHTRTLPGWPWNVSLWQQVEVRDAEKGPLMIELLKRHVATSRRSKGGSTEETLVVIRYRDRDQAVVKQDYYFSNAPVTTPHTEFGRVAKAEHRVEDCFDRGKGEAGMTDYEVRNWTGWQHHQTLSLVASWFLNVETRRAEKKDAGDDIQSGPEIHRIDHSNRISMRFTPRRHPPHPQATRTKPACPTLSLAQP